MSGNNITVTKRNGQIVPFNKDKIKKAVLKAFVSVDNVVSSRANEIADEIANYVESLHTSMTIEEIQDIVVDKLLDYERKDVSIAYIEYRSKRNIVREFNTTDKSVLDLIDGKNDYWNKENSNKNSDVATVQRDYLAGITSTDITKRFLLPDDIIKAHNEGILHFHKQIVA